MQKLYENYPIQKRKVLKKSALASIKALGISAIIQLAILGLLWGAAAGDGDKFSELLDKLKLPLSAITGSLLLWILSAPIYETIYFLNYFYDNDENNVFIRKGIFAKREITLPFSKITDVYVDQDIWDVILGLYDLHISTPTAESGKFAHIDGLNKKGANAIKKMILDKVNKITVVKSTDTHTQAEQEEDE